MICPRCKQEIIDGIKFCTKCGVNIQEEKERQATEERKKQEEIERKQKEAEEKKRLEEIRKQEEQKREEELKEAEKAEAIKKAKEEGIELEIIDKQPEPEAKQEEKEFKVKKVVEPKEKKEKKKKVKLKKNIFQVIFGKLLFIIIVAALIIGGVYYCYRQELLPEFAQKEIKDFESKLQNVIEMKKEVKENKQEEKEATNNEWEVKLDIEASDIKDLNKEVSVIIKGEKQGLIDNKTGKIVLEPKYTKVYIADYTRIAEGEFAKVTKGIVVKDIEKEYEVDSEYKIAGEVKTVVQSTAFETAYFYNHHDSIIYESLPTGEVSKVKPTRTSNLKICSDIDIVTQEGLSSAKDILPESFIIDYEKSKVTTKGYFDTKTGELVIDCNYDEVLEFSEGYAAVKEEKKAGIIDEEGKTVVDFKYDETRSVHNGFAFAKKDGKWGILKVK